MAKIQDFKYSDWTYEESGGSDGPCYYNKTKDSFLSRKDFQNRVTEKAEYDADLKLLNNLRLHCFHYKGQIIKKETIEEFLNSEYNG